MLAERVSNHPNRNWRRRMEQAADQFLESSAGKVLVEVPLSPGSVQGLRNRIREAYLSGYRDGRKRTDDE
ncbi:MAG TPA: hypothetical protein VLH79_07170 [Chthonomonadales bacterium]|nr:hypothetical protein [Chthonomonadales bacterium]